MIGIQSIIKACIIIVCLIIGFLLCFPYIISYLMFVSMCVYVYVPWKKVFFLIFAILISHIFVSRPVYVYLLWMLACISYILYNSLLTKCWHYCTVNGTSKIGFASLGPFHLVINKILIVIVIIIIIIIIIIVVVVIITISNGSPSPPPSLSQMDRQIYEMSLIPQPKRRRIKKTARRQKEHISPLL